ncbi:MAG: NAD(P)/FAD-dependent oxidoreductase [Spirochaetia bacterium]|nr:NAD(P)/FAD-dependent oxidoreductase [Spirochaetia bacterium]
MKKLLILGSGTGGTVIANGMRKKLKSSEWDITIIDKNLDHIYQPGLLFLPFKLYGYNDETAVRKDKKKFIPSGVNFVQAEIKLVDHKKKTVETSAGKHSYDMLVVALGCDVHPEEIEGMEKSLGSGVNMFYTLDSAMQLQKDLAKIEKGRVIMNIAELPYKCPVAPLEFVYLADYYFTLKGIRDQVEIALVTPMDGAFSKPIASKILGSTMGDKNIKIIPKFSIASVDNKKKKITSYEKHEEPYDLLVSVPPNRGSDMLDDSGLANGSGYMDVDPQTLKSKKADFIYALGDVTDVKTSKAGSVTHFMADVVIENLMHEINGKQPSQEFDGHSNCFIESGFKKAFLIDFNYTVEPLPGKFPMAGIGPFGLLKDTKINHMGKMAFRNMYWEKILKHKPLAPFGLVTNKMSLTGKDTSLLKK